MMVAGTAREKGMISCGVCHFLTPKENLAVKPFRCPRCGSKITSRKENSLHRTWALLIAAVIFYVPANVFPILSLVSFGSKSSETILSGIFQLFESGQWVIAMVVLIASVFVPVFKIAGLAFLALSVQQKYQRWPKQRTALYRFIELIGRWSMIDVFMISVLIALVQLNALATVAAQPGAIAFAAVVVLTMFAAMAFDPRLIWDQIEDKSDG